MNSVSVFSILLRFTSEVVCHRNGLLPPLFTKPTSSSDDILSASLLAAVNGNSCALKLTTHSLVTSTVIPAFHPRWL